MMHVRVYHGCITIITAFGDSFMPIIPCKYDIRQKDISYLACTKTGVAMYSRSWTLSFSSPEVELCERDEAIEDGSEMPCFNKSTYMIICTA